MAYQTPEAYVLDHRSKYNDTFQRFGFYPDEYQKELVEIKRILEEGVKTYYPDIYNEIMENYKK